VKVAKRRVGEKVFIRRYRLIPLYKFQIRLNKPSSTSALHLKDFLYLRRQMPEHMILAQWCKMSLSRATRVSLRASCRRRAVSRLTHLQF